MSEPRVYVSPCYHKDDSEACEDVEYFLHQWLAEPGLRQIALLGDYGKGKSTAALVYTYRLLFETPEGLNRIPILIELRGKSPRNLTPLELLGAWTSQYRIDPQALMHLLIAGRLLLIFEGFDEMALVGDLQMRLAHFKTLWAFAYPGSKILITGRPNFFLDDEEMKAALGIQAPSSQYPYCEAISLASFDIPQIREALRPLPQQTREQICYTAENNTRFKDLVSRPSTLYYVSTLWEREQLAERAETLNSAKVMELFVRNSYRRQGLKEKDAPGFMALTQAEREFFMRGISAFMAAHQLPNQIDAEKLNESIESLLKIIPDEVSTYSSTITGETAIPLRKRILGDEHGVEHVQTDVRTAGLLVSDPVSPGTFHFGHKSIMEYLFAATLAELLIGEKPEITRLLLKATGANIGNILSLPVSIEFLAELVASTRGETIGTASQEDLDQAHLTFSRRLLYQMSGGSQLGYLFGRIRLMESTLERFRKTGSWIQRLILYIIQPTNLYLLLVIPVLLLWSINENQEIKFPFGLNWRFLIIIMTIAAIISFHISNLLLIQLIRSTRKLVIEAKITRYDMWAKICLEAGVPDTILHRVAGTWLIPWLREIPFYSE